VKPLRLVVEGFTSFRDRVELDLSGLDLFAITGPTGSGKSSLIDAIVFALYGQVPRVGDDYKQLISHGAERLSVLLEFAVGGERYRIARAARLERASQQRFERLGSAGAVPITDKARDIRVEVERLLGLDYDGFTRSVVLPQGQFDAFLKGEPKERRKILVALLNLGVYERMQQLANQKATSARSEAEFLRKQIETDYAGVTPAALDEARSLECQAEAAAAEAERSLQRLAEAAERAQRARGARREAETLQREEAAERTMLSAAQATIEGGDRTTAELAARRAALTAQLEATGCDEVRASSLTAALPRADQLLALEPRVAKLSNDLLARRRALEGAQQACAEAEAALPRLSEEESRAREAEQQARAARDAAHREHLALVLRQGLKAGDPCPVCSQPTPPLAAAEQPVLDAAEERVRAAEAARAAASERLQAQRLALAQRQGAVQGLFREREQLEEQLRDTSALAGEVAGELRKAGVLEIELADPRGLTARIRSELLALQAARRARADLEERRRAVEQEQARLSSELSAAAARRDTARSRLEAIGQSATAAAQKLELARRELLALAAEACWPGLDALPAGRDEVDVVESLRASAQRSSAEAAARLATARHCKERIETALVRLAELRAERERLEALSALHKTLADHLKANELVAWIQEEALFRLAVEGSRHLARLSQNRYELRLGEGEGESAARAEQDFFVVDHWNGDAVRSVRTLSGGETFLASLALALALAESLAQLSTGGRAKDTLESLFLDEGFGTLDNDALEVVVAALDALHGGQRMVGIVTHVRDLAERLPARLEVRRLGSAGAATAAIA